MNIVHLRPKQRSKYRIMLGSGITLQRGTFSGWQMENICKRFQQEKLPCTAIQHRTILLRKLKDVDMWYQQNKVVNLKIAVKN